MRRMLKLLLFAVVLFASTPIGAGGANMNRSEWVLTKEISLGTYVIQIHGHQFHQADGTVFHSEDRLTIEKSGRIVETVIEQRIDIDPIEIMKLYGGSRVTVGGDLTGDGIPNLLAVSYSGGAHCCFHYYVYSLGNNFQKLDELEEHDASIEFLNLDDDAALEAQSKDYVFANWYASFGSSPGPRIVFKFENGKYRIAPDLMRRPLIPEEVLNRKSSKLRTRGSWGKSPKRPYDPNVWEVMLDLIYTGHYARAYHFLNEAWPPSMVRKEQFRHEFFECQLRRSAHWFDIAKMNNVPAEAPSPNCPPCPECE
jgi:hypothetical protein